MPLGLFNKKDRMLKEKSKSTFDLFHTSEKLQVPERKLLKKKSGSTLNLFATKSSNTLQEISTSPSPPDIVEGLTKADKTKSKSLFHLSESVKIRSKSSQNLMDSNNNSLAQFKEKVRLSTPVSPFRKISTGSSSSRSSSSSDDGVVRKNKVSTPSKLRSSKKRALGASTESIESTREKRMADIVQLDNYIEYLKKSDDCSIVNISNRLCCAQVLRLVLLRQQRMLDNDVHHTSAQERNAFINYRNNLKSNADRNPAVLSSDQSPPLNNDNSARTLDNAPLDNRNQWSAEHSSSPASSPESQRGDRLFTRKGSNRKFKRTPPGQSDFHKNLARSNINSYHSDTSLHEDDETNSTDENLSKKWNSISSTSLADSTSDLSPSVGQNVDEVPTSQQKNQPLSIAVFSSDVEIY
ncbi:hypothetical protein BgiBS90_017581 [Biomphalaria glabrata]|nr:hypothetical protein BgiBS90_017581 [Biomphalaria glabrata]